MDYATALRIVVLCLVLASAETVHGIARTVLLAPRLGKRRALQLSVVTGVLLASLICWFLVPPIALQSTAAHLLLGVVLAAFMALFDVLVGRLLLRKSWAKIWPDFDPRTGNYLAYGLLALCFVPMAVMVLR